jgi:uncharacterized protein
MSNEDPFFPERAPIDAYGNNGFRFSGASHRGPLLIIPSGIYGWSLARQNEFAPEDFSHVFEEAEKIDFLLLGTGPQRLSPPPEVIKAFVKANVGLELMDTGAACRTFNVLLGEERAVAAALLPVE